MLPVSGYFGPRQTKSPRYERALFTYLGPVRLGKKRWIGDARHNGNYVYYSGREVGTFAQPRDNLADPLAEHPGQILALVRAGTVIVFYGIT